MELLVFGIGTKWNLKNMKFLGVWNFLLKKKFVLLYITFYLFVFYITFIGKFEELGIVLLFLYLKKNKIEY